MFHGTYYGPYRGWGQHTPLPGLTPAGPTGPAAAAYAAFQAMRAKQAAQAKKQRALYEHLRQQGQKLSALQREADAKQRRGRRRRINQPPEGEEAMEIPTVAEATAPALPVPAPWYQDTTKLVIAGVVAAVGAYLLWGGGTAKAAT